MTNQKPTYQELEDELLILRKKIEILELSEGSEKLNAAKHRKMIDSIGDAIVIIDSEGKNKYKSPNIEKMVGWKPADILGKSTWENVHPEDRKSALEFFTNLKREPNAVGTTEFRYKCKDNSYKWIELKGSNLLNDPEIEGILGNYHDITNRKQSEQALLESESRLKSLFQNLTSSSSLYEVIFDENEVPIDYRFLALNPAYERNIGISASKLIGKTLLEVFPSTEPVWLDTMKDVVLTGVPSRIENYSKEVDKYFELIIYTPQKGQMAMIGSDATERMKAEEALRKSEIKFSKAFKATPEATIITTLKDGRAIDVNDIFCKTTGYDRNEIIGHTTLELTIWVDANKRKQYVEELSTNGYLRNFEAQLKMRNGEVRLFVISSEVIELEGELCSINFIMDITQRRQTENENAALLEQLTIARDLETKSKDLLNAIMERVSDGFVAFDADFNYTYVNTYGGELLGKKAEELIGKNYWVEFPEAKGTPFANAYIQAMETQQTIFLEDHFEPWDRWFVNRIYPSKDGITIFYTDITSRKKAEAELIAEKNKTEISEQKYRTLFESSSNGIVIINPETTSFVEFNDKVCSQLGYTREEFATLTVFDIEAQETIEETKKRIRQVIETGGADFETKQKAKNGDIRDILVSARIIEVANKKVYHCIWLDITEQKQIEKELQQSRQMFQLLAENSSDAVSLIEQDGIQYTSPAYRKFIGIETNELKTMGMPQIFELIHPDDKERVVDMITKGREDKIESSSYDFRIRTRNGDYIWLEDVLKREFDDQGNIVRTIVNSRNITDRKLLELELIEAKEKAEESEYKVRSMVENTNSGILFSSPEGLVLEANPALISILGSPSLEATRQINILTFKPLIEIGFSQNVEKCLKEKTVIASDAVYTSRWGKTVFMKYFLIPIIIKNKIIGVWANLHDLTDLWETQNDLIKAKEIAEESKANIQAIIENTTNNIWAVDTNYKVTYINQIFKDEFYQSFGAHLNIGDHVITNLPLPIQPLWKSRYDRVFNNEQFTIEDKIEITPETFVYIQVSMNPIVVNGKVIGASFFGSNITERREQEQELIKAKEKAEESDRLKTAFLQNMSHEIRTPLNSISGFSGMLNKPEISDEKRKNFVSIIQNSSTQLLSIVTDILTISSLETKQERLKIGKVCINNLIIDLLTIFKQQSINQNISIYTKQQLTDYQSEIYTDKTKITQILTNLITNALKFTHEGFIEFGYELKNNELEFYVKDSGIGINPELHEKIFERFRQADKSIHITYGGTGLGLSISKGFVELFGGKIWVNSSPQKGTIFHFTIPYKPVNEIIKTEFSTLEIKNLATILVAEDEEFNFLLIEELLIDQDLQLIHAKDGKQALEICQTNSSIDLILMDIKMPIMDGYTAAELIKEFRPHLPIIAQSAYALEHEIEKFTSIFDDYITKPISEETLKQKLIKYIDIQTQ